MKNTILTAALAIAFTAVVSAVAAGEKTFTATVVLQKGLNGCEEANDSSLRAGRLKLDDDKKREIDSWTEGQIKQGKAKREEVLENIGNYRHVFRFPGLDRFILGKKPQVLSAKLELFYVDEFWSFYNYKLVLYRSLDGSKDNVEREPAAENHIFGDRSGKEATPLRSWIEFKLRPEVIQAWLDDPKRNLGLVLANPSKEDPPGKKSEGSGLSFASNTSGTAAERPRLTIVYRAEGGAPPFAPTLLTRFAGATVGTVQLVRWTMPEPPDLSGEAIHFELETAPADAEAWTPAAKDISGDAREYRWMTAAAPEGKPLRLRLRAVNTAGAASPWTVSGGAFKVVRRQVPFQIGIETPLVKLRRTAYGGALGAEAAVELARNEYEGFQVVVSDPLQDLKRLRLAAGDLKAEKGGAKLEAGHIAVNPVGFVHIIRNTPYTSVWPDEIVPDPLLNIEQVDVPLGKVQSFWVTLHAPPGTPAGIYRGTLTLTAENCEPQTVNLQARVFDFDLPVRGTFETMAEAGGPDPKFYGLAPGAELDKLKEAWYGFLCKHRLPPGGYALKCWGWNNPVYPAQVKADGSYDFSEVERWGKFCFDRGMTAFEAAQFAKLGKFGFAKEYSTQYREDFKKFMTAYSEFLKGQGWLKDALVYNIDEAPESMWEACKENYRQTKALSPAWRVFQCLNDPKGVAALDGFFDLVDVNVGQFNQGAAPKLLEKGNSVWWCICCWPSTHPNLFVDYPATDARIVGWLSWKTGVRGFEYWAVSSWDNCLKPLGGKKYVDEVESPWNANSFGKYNGDGYLLYPGPNNSLLSSIRLEALRDGFEDYEYLALLKQRLQGRTGPAAEEATALLNLSDELCKKDLNFTDDPAKILAARRRVAEAIEKLGAQK